MPINHHGAESNPDRYREGSSLSDQWAKPNPLYFLLFIYYYFVVITEKAA